MRMRDSHALKNIKMLMSFAKTKQFPSTTEYLMSLLSLLALKQ